MTTREKFEKWNEIFWKDFINLDPTTGGYCIPVEMKEYETGKFKVGDGTINLALLMTYLSLHNDNEKTPVTIDDCLTTITRLEKKAFDYFATKFPIVFDSPKTYCPGFFVRDDYDQDDCAWGSWKMLQTLENEDPCHSPFVSQDQVWNLNPILSFIVPNDKSYSHNQKAAREIGYRLNNFIVSNRFKVVNPYLSRIMHFFTYLPSMNEDKVKPWERQQDRDDHFKPNIKVKRGANNWYYSGGTAAANDFFITNGHRYNHTLRTSLYKGIVFFLDRIYEPIYKLFTNCDFKHNSYYCYAATSGIWYNSKFKKRFLKKFEKALEQGELFEPNLVPLILKPSDLSDSAVNNLFDYFESYKEPDDKDICRLNPIEFLILYKWYNS